MKENFYFVPLCNKIKFAEQKCEEISYANLKSIGGTLAFTFSQLISILKKHNRNYNYAIMINTINEEIIGYILYHDDIYQNGESVQLAQICLLPEMQGQGLMPTFINAFLLNYQQNHNNLKYVTAHVSDFNIHSQKMFTKLGFSFIHEPEKSRSLVVKELN